MSNLTRNKRDKNWHCIKKKKFYNESQQNITYLLDN